MDEEQTIPEEAELVSLQPTSLKLQTISLWSWAKKRMFTLNLLISYLELRLTSWESPLLRNKRLVKKSRKISAFIKKILELQTNVCYLWNALTKKDLSGTWHACPLGEEKFLRRWKRNGFVGRCFNNFSNVSQELKNVSFLAWPGIQWDTGGYFGCRIIPDLIRDQHDTS